jgi:dipeptidyl-peptidase-4
MTPSRTKAACLPLIILFFSSLAAWAQPGAIKWSPDGNAYYRIESNEIIQYDLPANTRSTFIGKQDLTPARDAKPLLVRAFYFSGDRQKLLIYTNTKKVWRADTRGDYWVMDLKSKDLKKLGAGRPTSSLMFAKFSPDASRVAYVSEQNLYVENLSTG